MVDKINPVYDVTLPRSFVGKSVQHLTVTMAVDITSATDPDDVVDLVVKALSLRATPIMISAIAAGGFDVYYEGEFPTDDYNSDGSDTTFAAQLQADIVALGATAGTSNLDVTGTTVAETAFFQADQTNT